MQPCRLSFATSSQASKTLEGAWYEGEPSPYTLPQLGGVEVRATEHKLDACTPLAFKAKWRQSVDLWRFPDNLWRFPDGPVGLVRRRGCGGSLRRSLARWKAW